MCNVKSSLLDTPIYKACAQFVAPCLKIRLLTKRNVAIDGSTFKAVNNRNKTFTPASRRPGRIAKELALEVKANMFLLV
jgi:transposase